MTDHSLFVRSLAETFWAVGAGMVSQKSLIGWRSLDGKRIEYSFASTDSSWHWRPVAGNSL